jgi:hypothetical protein
VDVLVRNRQRLAIQLILTAPCQGKQDGSTVPAALSAENGFPFSSTGL